ncbi:hypothetical protein EYF80_013526 [Liparis tanakae]|uniref:Uncharacterized protein n=1 Tax=Liparis tanakae TaxID=230148 RepID=A0A4Z2IDZ9_9TELE|nr:hypothetical protein EYF80_013526 [Liparis tanakae]
MLTPCTSDHGDWLARYSISFLIMGPSPRMELVLSWMISPQSMVTMMKEETLHHCRKRLPNQGLIPEPTEGADRQLHLVPLLDMGPGRVPDRTAERTPVDSNGPRAVAIAAVQEVAELDAVRVVFTQSLQQQLSTVTHGMLGRVHQHKGSWKEQKKCIIKLCSPNIQGQSPRNLGDTRIYREQRCEYNGITGCVRVGEASLMLLAISLLASSRHSGLDAALFTKSLHPALYSVLRRAAARPLGNRGVCCARFKRVCERAALKSPAKPQPKGVPASSGLLLSSCLYVVAVLISQGVCNQQYSQMDRDRQDPWTDSSEYAAQKAGVLVRPNAKRARKRTDSPFLCGAATCQASRGVRSPRDEAQQSRREESQKRTGLKASSMRDKPLKWRMD